MTSFESAFSFLDKFVSDFSWRRLSSFILFILILAGLFYGYEQYTRTFQLSKLEKAVNLLKELDTLRPSVTTDSTLKVIYNDIRNELGEIISHPIIASQPTSFWLKALAGATPWLLATLLFLPSIISGKSDISVLLGGFMFSAFFGAVATLMPDSLGRSFHYIWFPVGHFVIVVIILIVWQARKRAA